MTDYDYNCVCVCVCVCYNCTRDPQIGAQSVAHTGLIYLLYEQLRHLQVTVRQMFIGYSEVPERAKRITIIHI